MTDPAAIQGNYADFKLVKTRNVAQLVIEIPIERAKQAIDAFGIPQPSAEIAVAVARLNVTQQQDSAVAAPEGRTEPKERTRSQMAGIRCSDPEFAKWLGGKISTATNRSAMRSVNSRSQPNELVAEALRRHLNILSRKELDSNPAKAAAWDELEAKFIEDTRLPERH